MDHEIYEEQDEAGIYVSSSITENGMTRTASCSLPSEATEGQVAAALLSTARIVDANRTLFDEILKETSDVPVQQ